MSDLLEEFIHPKNSNPVARHRYSSYFFSRFCFLVSIFYSSSYIFSSSHFRLCHYVACGGVDAVSVFMKVERTRLRSDRYRNQSTATYFRHINSHVCEQILPVEQESITRG